ncbi:hypothetical protein YDYSY3_00880 [Paenibacillus chitinolyticus]|nr:hypothetical protein YDYSY3_00880 [Paenibacillus chitinolyticus]
MGTLLTDDFGLAAECAPLPGTSVDASNPAIRAIGKRRIRFHAPQTDFPS